MSLEELKAAYLEAVQSGDYDAANILLQRIQAAQAPEPCDTGRDGATSSRAGRGIDSPTGGHH
jgi:hypothetical protein